ncbi:dipeptidase PepV [Thermovenabulum gondwanense]|uniref:Putative dipeptidase n=1 Tax=Thermovenabulum gondwanense TaxID=520767 RepID=A0A162N3E8_9FIRM|nr:dipeptidase PepV [Thermovenabulum gondwanense]KYO68742.1 putative dipeptidase [Thermovenabulum gondwanense]
MNLEAILKENENALINSVCEILRIRSVEEKPLPGMPFGKGVADALNYVLKLSESFGLRTKNLDNYVGWAEWGEGKDLIGILVHLDVVPEGSNWSHPPFGGEIHDGKIYGRGASDNKGPAIAALYALKALKDANLNFKKRVRIIFGTNEESGMECIKYYLQKDEMPAMGFSPDAEYPIINGEKGILTFSIKAKFDDNNGSIFLTGGERANMVPDYAHCVINYYDGLEKDLENFKGKTGFSLELVKNGSEATIKSYGVSAHGSIPEKGQNAISRLISFLVEIKAGSQGQREFLKFLMDKIGFETNGKSLGINLEDEVSGRLTLNLGVINMNENEAEAIINIRYPISFKGEDIIGTIERNLKKGIFIDNVKNSPPHYVPEDSPIVKALKAAYEKVTGEKAYCFTIGGGTYARMMKNTVAFGPNFPGKPEVAHEKDEYIEIEDLIKNFKIYTYVLKELAC